MRYTKNYSTLVLALIVVASSQTAWAEHTAVNQVFYCRTQGLRPVAHRHVRDLSRTLNAELWAVSKCTDLTDAAAHYCEGKWAAGLDIDLRHSTAPLTEAVLFKDLTQCRLDLANQIQTLATRTDLDTYRCYQSATTESLVMTNESGGSNYDAWREWQPTMQNPTFKRCLPPPGAEPTPIPAGS